MTPAKPKIEAVGLFAFNAATERYELRASARLRADGTVAIEGSPVLAQRLREDAVRTDAGTFITEDGAAYLEALIWRYTDPHLKAMPLKS